MATSNGTLQPGPQTRIAAGLSLARSLERARVHALTIRAEATTIRDRALRLRELQPSDAASIRETLQSIEDAKEWLMLALTLESVGASL